MLSSIKSHIHHHWDRFQNDPIYMRKLNGWLAVIWLAAALPICIFLASSVPFLVFVSVYAVVTGHWSTWQSARVEVRQEDESVVEDVIEALDKKTDVEVSPK
jgi:hypothetical protein